jgi:L-lactate dehydrogenase complex protein LldG
MNNLSSRTQILEKLHSSTQQQETIVISNETSIFNSITTSLEHCFKTELEEVSGTCILCKTIEEAIIHLQQILSEHKITSVFCRENNWINQLKKSGITVCVENNDFILTEAGLTSCEFLIARTGSVMVSSKTSGRQLNIYPPIHIVFAQKSQLVPNITDALKGLQEKYKGDIPSCISLVSGPSRTADIEKTLVLGAHGPKALYVFIYEKETFPVA